MENDDDAKPDDGDQIGVSEILQDLESDQRNVDSSCETFRDKKVPSQSNSFHLGNTHENLQSSCSDVHDGNNVSDALSNSSSLDCRSYLGVDYTCSAAIEPSETECSVLDSDASLPSDSVMLERGDGNHCIKGSLNPSRIITSMNSVSKYEEETVSYQRRNSISTPPNSKCSISNTYSVLSANPGETNHFNYLESDSFDCSDEPAAVPRYEENTSNRPKRNRQISTDSSSSAAVEMKDSAKSTKKPKKKERKKKGDEEIEKILRELELVRKVPSSKEKLSVEELALESGSLENLPSVNKTKKKKKKKKRRVENEEQNSIVGVCGLSAVPVCNAAGDCLVNRDELKENENSARETLVYAVKGKEGQCHSVQLKGCSVLSSNVVDEGVNPLKPKESNDAKKERKRPCKKLLAVMQAAVRKAKEEEERCLREEIARQKKAEEAEMLRLEKLRLEQAKKEKKKQKEKDRKERLKAAGKFLTKSQKLARARVEAALSAWREHGIDVPKVGEKILNNEPKALQKKRLQDSSLSRKENPGGVIDEVSENNTELERTSFRQRRFTDPSACGRESSSSDDTARRSFSKMSIDSSVQNRIRTKSETDVTRENQDSRKLLHKDSKELKTECRESSVFRSPVVCVLGHVDTGKTKILDKIRKTHVQDNEAGGITQQIGATMVPADALKEKCSMVKSFANFDLQLPGLLIIDTPGHESFGNLRSRGSSLCDVAILVVDIMHGLESQTIESIDLLKQKKTPFVVALNKIDRLYGWQPDPGCDIEDVLSSQNSMTFMEFDKRCKQVIAEFAVQSLNAALFTENPDPRSYLSLVPVSAVSGDGMGNLLAHVSQLCQNMMSKRLTYTDNLEATVLEVKATAGLGTTIDVILVNGQLKETDTIVLVGQDGPIVSQIRSLLMPQPLRELRVKNPYQEFKVVKGAQGVKVAGKDLDRAIAGLPLFVSRGSDDVPSLKEKASRLLRQTMSSIKLSERGVYVQASTLGSLEALLDFLKTSDIPYAGVKVGPVVKKDVIKASVMLEHDVQYAVILAFDVKIEREAQELADHLGIKIFQADIIYHLFDNFIQYKEELREKKLNDAKKSVVFPCKLKILPECVFSARCPIILGVRVDAGVLKVGTPLCVPSKNFMRLGTVSTIEVENQTVECAKVGDEVCIKIESCSEEGPKTYGRHFDHADLLVSKISRQTIDICKEFYRDDLKKSDWNLMVELKKMFLIT